MRQIPVINRKLNFQQDLSDFSGAAAAIKADAEVTGTRSVYNFTGTGTGTVVFPRRVVDFRLPDDTAMILSEGGMQAYRFIRKFTRPAAAGCVLSTVSTDPFSALSRAQYEQVVNLRRVNDIRRINKFFETVNIKLKKGGIFIGKVETYLQKKKKIMSAYPPGINTMVYTLHYLFTRVFPKLPYTKQLFYLTTRGNNRVLSKAETYGRLYSCGFEVIGETSHDGFNYFACRKIKEPAYDTHPTYGMFIRLKRIGKGGELFNVYKLRTMHAYSEYLQQYVYEKSDLEAGGKFRDDFRVTTVGKVIRKFWIDELPMLINMFIKRNMKIVGVRPLSEHYFSLYSDELKQKRIQFKPGLIPPYYAQYPTPKSLDEIQLNEMDYLGAYEKHPVLTDLKYCIKVLGNIIFRKARSR